MTANRILLLTADAEVERTVARASQSSGLSALEVDVVRSKGEFEKQLDARSTSIALVDVGSDPLAFLRSLEPVLASHPHTRLVVLCEEQRTEVVLEAMQVGARHCLDKPSVASDLPGVLQRLLRARPAATVDGKIVTVLSAGGGSGSTTLAINLAEEIRRRSTKDVLLVDLDVSFGGAASYLGVEGRFGVADAFADAGRIDPNLVSSTACVYSEGFHLLLSPASIDFSEPTPIRWENLELGLEACQGAYAHTVIDAPRVSPGIAATLARESALTLIVFQLNVLGVRNARSIVAALRDRGAFNGSCLLVANRYRKRTSAIDFGDAKKALGDAPIVLVRNDFAGASRAVNFGELLARVAPRSPLRKDLFRLAEKYEQRSSEA